MDERLIITLAAARVNAGLTQEEAAGKIGVAKSTLVAWEKGKTSPTVKQADRIYELYDRPVGSIRF